MTGSAAASPMRAVLAEFGAGATSLSDIARRTGLDRGLVDAVVERLIAMGHISREQLGSGCPPQGCGGCASADGAGDPCEAGPQRAAGPVLLTLAVKPQAG